MILAWVNDIYEGLASFVTGMRTTAHFLLENLRDQGGAAAVTRQYPEQEALVIGDRVRGHLFNDGPRCIVCHACDKVCPVDCFVMDGERDEHNKMRASRFDIDLSKCIYCGLCVRACPTDSLSMTTAFEMDPHRNGQRYLFRRNSQQLDQRFDAPDVQRLTELANKPGAQLTADEQQWLGARIDPRGPHLIGLYGLGYFTAEEKLRVDSEREARKKAKDAEAQQAKAAAAAAAAAARPKDPVAPPAGATAPAPPPQPPGGAAS